MITNLKEAKELVRKYRSLTEEDFTSQEYQEEYEPSELLSKVTGFGKVMKCTLCVAAGVIGEYFADCRRCIYAAGEEKAEGGGMYCYKKNVLALKTYVNIENAESIDNLLVALKDRADFLESIINDYEKEMKHDRA